MGKYFILFPLNCQDVCFSSELSAKKREPGSQVFPNYADTKTLPSWPGDHLRAEELLCSQISWKLKSAPIPNFCSCQLSRFANSLTPSSSSPDSSLILRLRLSLLSTTAGGQSLNHHFAPFVGFLILFSPVLIKLETSKSWGQKCLY